MTSRTFFTSLLSLSLYVGVIPPTLAQEAGRRSITLTEVIEIAHHHSTQATVALAKYRTAYWQYRTAKANYLPEVNFQGSLPNYKSGFNLYQDASGNYSYVRSRSLQSAGSLSIDQNISLTGGRLSVVSSLEYLTNTKGTRHFMTIPVTLTLVQPLWGYNAFKWERRISPVKYEEAKAQYLEERERITMSTVSHYFQLLLADEALSIARQNKENARKLYEVAKVRREMGQISHNDLLQLELNLLQAEGRETSVAAERSSKLFLLKNYVGITTDEDIAPQLPAAPLLSSLDYDEVMQRARRHNSLSHRIRRQQLEADSQVAQAKGEQFKVDLYASVGFSGRDTDLRPAYSQLMDNQVVQVGVRIPLLDWGKRKAQVRMAESNRDVAQAQVQQEVQRFEQDMFLLVRQFNTQAQQLQIARKADEIAERRYQTSIESFMIGKISTLELNDAQRVRDEAHQQHISELFYYWYYLHQVKGATLYDYESGRAIDLDFDLLTRE